MKTVQAKLSSIVLVVAFISVSGMSVFAPESDPVCTAEHHGCDKAAKISTCCCGDQGDASNQGGPIESRVQLNPNLTVAPTAFIPTEYSRLSRTIARPHTSPPRAGPLDLPTLFASLLI